MRQAHTGNFSCGLKYLCYLRYALVEVSLGVGKTTSAVEVSSRSICLHVQMANKKFVVSLWKMFGGCNNNRDVLDAGARHKSRYDRMYGCPLLILNKMGCFPRPLGRIV